MFSCKSQRCPFNGGVSPHGFKGWWSSSCWEGDYFSWKFFFLFWNVSKHLRHLRHFPETTFGSLTVSLWELNGPWCIPASWGCVAGYLPLACLLPRILWLEVLSVYLLFPEALRHRGQCVCVCVCVCVYQRERERDAGLFAFLMSVSSPSCLQPQAQTFNSWCHPGKVTPKPWV